MFEHAALVVVFTVGVVIQFCVYSYFKKKMTILSLGVAERFKELHLREKNLARKEYGLPPCDPGKPSKPIC
jgi:hypothetical protein